MAANRRCDRGPIERTGHGSVDGDGAVERLHVRAAPSRQPGDITCPRHAKVESGPSHQKTEGSVHGERRFVRAEGHLREVQCAAVEREAAIELSDARRESATRQLSRFGELKTSGIPSDPERQGRQ